MPPWRIPRKPLPSPTESGSPLSSRSGSPKQGQETETFSDGSSITYMTSDGVRHGKAWEQLSDGLCIAFKYDKGVRQGPAKLTSYASDGSIEFTVAWTYVDGVNEGKAVDTCPGSRIEFQYVKGEMQGKAKESFDDGRAIEFCYVNGIRQGVATERLPDGRVVSLRYKDGERVGEKEMEPDADKGESEDEMATGGDSSMAAPPIYKVKKVKKKGDVEFGYMGLVKQGREWEALEHEWALTNFGQAFLDSLKIGEVRTVPQGRSCTPSAETKVTAVVGAPPVRAQGDEEHCVCYGLAGALRHCGFLQAADALEAAAAEILSSKSHTAKAAVKLVSDMGGWKDTGRLTNFDPLTNRSPHPTIVQLCDSEGEARHVVGIAGDWIFDSNRSTAMPLTHENLDAACPGKSLFSRVTYATRFTPTTKRSHTGKRSLEAAAHPAGLPPAPPGAWAKSYKMARMAAMPGRV